jgi:hypothetical protein
VRMRRHRRRGRAARLSSGLSSASVRSVTERSDVHAATDVAAGVTFMAVTAIEPERVSPSHRGPVAGHVLHRNQGAWWVPW